MILSASDFFSRSPAELPPDAEDAFFSAIRNRNRTFKRTHRHRFAQLDRQLVDELRSRHAGSVELLDVGISSGATTLDLREALAAAGLRPRVTGTDLAINGLIVPLGAGFTALASSDGHPLQFAIGKVVVRPWPRRLDWLTGMWLLRPLLLRWLERRLRAAWQDERHRARLVLLVSPRVRQQSGVQVIEDNVLVRRQELARRFDLIRAANILNRDYFAAADLQRAVRNLTSYLAGPGAYLLIVRSLESGAHHGTLFTLDGERRLTVLRRFGEGSEIEQLALSS